MNQHVWFERFLIVIHPEDFISKQIAIKFLVISIFDYLWFLLLKVSFQNSKS